MLPANIETRAYRGEDVEVIVSDWIRDQEVAAIAARYGIHADDYGYVVLLTPEKFASLEDELWPWTVEGVERTT